MLISGVTAPALPLQLDKVWAEILGCEPAELRRGHLVILPREGDDVHVFLTPDGGVVAVPPAGERLVADASPEQLTDPGWWATTLGVPSTHLAWHGPAAIWYTTPETFVPQFHPFARQLRRRDAGELARFARILQAREPETFHYWAIGGREIGQVRLWGLYYQGRLVAVAGERPWGSEVREIGINVLPRWRQQGFGTAVVSLATDDILKEGALPMWVCALSNLPATRIAVRLGYRPYAHHFWFRPNGS